MQSLTVALLNSLVGPNFSSAAGLANGLPISVRVTPMLPPIVLVGQGTLATFQVHDLFLEIHVGTGAASQKLFGFRIALELPIDKIELDVKNGTIRPTIDVNRTVLEFDTLDSPNLGPIVGNLVTLVGPLVRAALPMLVDLVARRPVFDAKKLPIALDRVEFRARNSTLVTTVQLR